MENILSYPHAIFQKKEEIPRVRSGLYSNDDKVQNSNYDKNNWRSMKQDHWNWFCLKGYG